MLRIGAAIARSGLVVGVALAVAVPAHPAAIVAPGEDVERAIIDAPAGAAIVLAPGRHAGFAVARTVHVVGGPGVVVDGEVRILASGARVSDLTVLAREDGVTVREADDVLLERITVTDARMHGIQVVDATATVRDCAVSVSGSYAQGVEVRNANGRGRSVVRSCSVHGGQEAIVAHVSRVEFYDNDVSGTSLRAIAITEMSEGIAARTTIDDATGVGLYCGDMSHCEFTSNVAHRVSDAGNGVRSQAGIGALAWFESTMWLRGNDLTGAERPVVAGHRAATTDRSPLSIWPGGWRGALPGLGVLAASLAGLGLVVWLVGPIARRSRRVRPRPSQTLLAVVAGGVVVQTFHMLEHGVQVFQVYVADAEVRSGLAGARVDTEWVHFGYNLAVLALMGLTFRVVPAGARAAYRVLLATTLIQGYHLAEHVVKLIQHLGRGIDPAPGIVGGRAGLVWFHLGINAAVYTGLAIAVGLGIRALLREDRLSGAPVSRLGLRAAIIPAPETSAGTSHPST